MQKNKHHSINDTDIELSEVKNSLLNVNGSISYVSQSAWVMNETVRNNIIFFNEYDEKKFNEIVDICELRTDIDHMEGGEMTEIGEKGINLSGGQRVRLSIARAVYAGGDIFIFDDPLSALDANVGSKIFNNVILDHLRCQTRIVVTHALQYVQDADRIFYMKNGKIVWKGNYDQIIKQPFYSELSNKLKNPEENDNNNNDNKIEDLESSAENDKSTNKSVDLRKNSTEICRITKDDEQELGKVKRSLYLTYISYMGGVFIFLTIIIVLVIWISLLMLSDLWLANWSAKKGLDRSENLFNFGIYSLFGLGSTCFTLIHAILTKKGVMHLNKNLHDSMIYNLIRAPINLFHDVTTKGQILSRLSNDLLNISETFTNYRSIFSLGFFALGSIVMCSIFQKWSLLFLPFLLLSTLAILNFYLKAGVQLNRLEAISRSNLSNVFYEVYSGYSTICAFGNSTNFLEKLYKRMDILFSVFIYSIGSNQWFAITLDFVFFSFLSFFIGFSIIFENTFSVQSIGLLLSYSLLLSDYVKYSIDNMVYMEKNMVSLDRCHQYTKIVQEKHYHLDLDKKFDSSWPVGGEINFNDLHVRYRPESDIILKNLNFRISAKEKIGVVGRTGSGKSTLCLSLFRILEPALGTIYIDGVDITHIGLKKLRSSISIIPQDPTLFEGTLKYNIDPLENYNESQIKQVIEDVGLSYVLNGKEGLNMKISENGQNLSVGERQLICISRAILRNSKIIVMDEATSSVDNKTETLIQKAINGLLKDYTVITIAHRIKTILNYDKILVMSHGEIMEFDTPDNLINNKSSYFYEMYSKSNI